MRHQSLASSTRTCICTQSRVCPLTCAHPYMHAHRGRNGFYRHKRLQLRSSLPAKGPRVKEVLLPTSAMHKWWNFKGWDLMGGLGYWALCASTMRGWITTGQRTGPSERRQTLKPVAFLPSRSWLSQTLLSHTANVAQILNFAKKCSLLSGNYYEFFNNEGHFMRAVHCIMQRY